MAGSLTKYIPRGSIWLCPLIIIASDLIVNGMSTQRSSPTSQKQSPKPKPAAPARKEVPRVILHRIEEFMKKQ
ncbi:unnamed protein product [Kluyveromyces dobzhanskii CBS 2104]|uniref:WGS project CCBQ000000000 data, contig 00106 n=1 Tax=Kluyveromyces dobzhanskii CBS 2104 TaxID=1427455 RepID=A0A0A8L7I8_9SACH|nr:unnamed protein product [Kluyveromyces dobzhanskii CBS 2104]